MSLVPGKRPLGREPGFGNHWPLVRVVPTSCEGFVTRPAPFAACRVRLLLGGSDPP
jgi:hypothetical protein